jgi:hypothetical protein
MQFYNYRIIKELDKLDQQVQNFEIYISGVIYQEFNNYLKSGKIIKYEDFKKIVKYDLTPIIKKANNIVDKFVAENEKEIEEEMQKRGRVKTSAIQKKVIDITDQLKVYGEMSVYDSYKIYIMMCGEFK